MHTDHDALTDELPDSLDCLLAFRQNAREELPDARKAAGNSSA